MKTSHINSMSYIEFIQILKTGVEPTHWGNTRKIILKVGGDHLNQKFFIGNLTLWYL